MFRAVSEGASAAIFIYQSDRFSYFNPAMRAITGYGKKELMSLALAEIAHPDSRELAQKRKLAWQRGEPLTQHYELKILTKSAEERWLDVSGSRLDVHGIPAVVGVTVDITDRKRQEGQLENLLGQLHWLANRLQTMRELERASLAREIHDQLGKVLTAIKLGLGRISRELDNTGRLPLGATRSILNLIDQAIIDVRRIATNLRPGVLDTLGLPAAIGTATSDFRARTGIKCHMRIQHEGVLQDQERATALFRIFQEVLTNVPRHSGATDRYVQLGRKDNCTLLEIRDNGVRIQPELVTSGGSLGILGMRERSPALAGRLEIVGRPRKGTTVTGSIPDPCATVGT